MITKEEAFDDIIHKLEATANHFYGPNDKMWNILLKTRDKLKIEFSKECPGWWGGIDIKR